MLAILSPAARCWASTAIAVVLAARRVASMGNAGPHGFSEMLYAFTSATGNNGSAFGGLSANTPFYNITIGSRDADRSLLR